MWLKKYLKPLIFFFVALSIGVTWFINIQSPELNMDQRVDVNRLLNGESEVIKSYVWNPDNRLSIGVIKDQVEPVAYATELCRKIELQGAFGVSITLVDVLKLQQSGGEEWEEIGYVKCRLHP